MVKILRVLLWWCLRRLAWLRYRVRVVHGERLRDLRGPTIVMPNHSGNNDPPLVLSHLHLQGGIRPVVYSGSYRIPVLYPLMRLVDALEVPDLGEHSRGASERTIAMIDAVVAGLKRGENFLLYASGKIQRRGIEEIGANRAAAEIIERCPEANIVLVRTRGVWGSMFTCAPTGRIPDLARCMLRCAGLLVANLLFFIPRRQVTMTIEVLDRARLPGVQREKLNPFLEEWYNRGGPEAATFVPYHRLFGPRTFHFPVPDEERSLDLSKITPAIIQSVRELLEERLGRPLSEEETQPGMSLDQLGMDSLERMDFALRIEDRFGFHSDQVPVTVGQLWALAEGQLTADGAPLEAPPAWGAPPCDDSPTDVLAETLAEAFVRRVFQQPGAVAVADRVSGVLTRRRMLVATQLLGKRMAALPGDAVGVLLPSSAAADIVFFALHCNGKLPVMLNWTTGPANLAHAVRTLGIRRVITSRKLIDRLGIEVQGADYVYLEDLRSTIGKIESLGALLATYLAPGRLLRRLPRPDPDAPAVVLFTSGSESTPKAVPLSHRNLIANGRASLAVLQAAHGDTVLGMLPPFHSFGLLGNVVLPLLAGIRMVHHPDPTDAAGLVRTIAAYGATIAITTPTFLSYMLAAATPEDLRTLRTIITGAEKCPEALFVKARQMAPQVTILEGYGITECSPVVSGNRRELIKPGTVGPPVNDVEVCVVDPESKQPLPTGATGLLLVRGPSIFRGYLHYDGPDPFVEVAGHRWYVTGDLVDLDDDRYIHFRGRLKRFLKVGGEMVSLPALEEPFQDRYPPTENGPRVAVEGVETPAGRWIVLFTTEEIALREASAVLVEAGLRGVMRVDEVVRLDSIPVLGTGKTDYKELRKLAVDRASAAAKAGR